MFRRWTVPRKLLNLTKSLRDRCPCWTAAVDPHSEQLRRCHGRDSLFDRDTRGPHVIGRHDPPSRPANGNASRLSVTKPLGQGHKETLFRRSFDTALVNQRERNRVTKVKRGGDHSRGRIRGTFSDSLRLDSAFDRDVKVAQDIEDSRGGSRRARIEVNQATRIDDYRVHSLCALFPSVTQNRYPRVIRRDERFSIG